jgi:hypothetical protein
VKRALGVAFTIAAVALAEYALRIALADRAIVDGLLAPGAHSSPFALMAALGFLLLRLTLFVGVPAVAAAAVVIVVISKVSERTQALSANRALSSRGPAPGGRDAQEP